MTPYDEYFLVFTTLIFKVDEYQAGSTWQEVITDYINFLLGPDKRLTINEDTIKDLIKPGWRDLTSNLNESEKQVETTLFNKMDDLLQQQKMI